ncbi:MAG: methyltransferase domain-containing protein [Legionellaceae bacterium]|nr:methyltransferase domain-containing protein [Legionellaceae bacterium]
MKKVNFDHYTENYNQLLNVNTQFFVSNEEYFAKYKVDIVRHHTNHSVSRVLEYGCGIGRNIPFLQAAFPEAVIVGSDISSTSLEMAKALNPTVDFFQESINDHNQLPFDLIFVAGVFHHVSPNERSFVTESLFNRLSPSGSVMIFEHNPFNPITRRIVSNCPYDEDAVLLAPSEMKNRLRQSGFLIENHAYCLFIPPRFPNLTKIEKYIGWLPLGGQYWIQARKENKHRPTND